MAVRAYDFALLDFTLDRFKRMVLHHPRDIVLLVGEMVKLHCRVRVLNLAVGARSSALQGDHIKRINLVVSLLCLLDALTLSLKIGPIILFVVGRSTSLASILPAVRRGRPSIKFLKRLYLLALSASLVHA